MVLVLSPVLVNGVEDVTQMTCMLYWLWVVGPANVCVLAGFC